MSRSDKAKSRRGIRRPLVFLALLWISFLLLRTALHLPLRLPTGAERALTAAIQEKQQAEEPGKAVPSVTDKREVQADGLPGTVSGRIRELSVTSSGSYSLIIGEAVFAPEGEAESLGAGTVLAYFPVNCELKHGYTVRLQGNLHLFSEGDNPGSFNPRAYYLSLDIGCYMEAQALRVEERNVYLIREAARQVRDFLEEGLRMTFPPEEAGLLSAMLLGDRSGLEKDTQQLYETAGLSHLLSVSGLHVSFWALVISRLFGVLLTLFPFNRGKSCFLRFGFSFLRGMLAALAVLFYMILSGGRVPVRRAGLMALLFYLARALRVSYDLPSALSLSALSILIPYPYALFQPSFQLSFGCVLILGCLLPFLIEKLHCEALLSQSLLVPVTLQMGTLPVSLYHSFCFHPYSVLANLLVLPFFGLILAGGMLSALLAHLSRPIGLIAGGGVHLLLEGIRRLCLLIENAPLGTLVLGRPAFRQIAAYLFLAAAGLALIFRVRKREWEEDLQSLLAVRKRTLNKMLREVKTTALLLFFWLLGAGSVFLFRNPETLRITSFYVGQGDSHLIELPGGHSYLLDVGSAYGDMSGTETVLPALRFYGIRRLEYVLVSHCDADHINGLDELLTEPSLSVGGLILPTAWRGSPKSLPLLQAAGQRNIPVIFMGAGWSWEDQTARFEILYPEDAVQYDPGNESSLVVKLSYGTFSALFTGDLGFPGEEYLLNRQREAIRDICFLKVGHHGSKYSSAAAFLQMTSPEIAFISCGRNNRYGHPAPETLTRLEAAGSKTLRTDRDGAVTLLTAQDGNITLQTYHQEVKNMTQNEEEKITKSTWISCGIIIGIGMLALCLSLWGPKKGEEEGSSVPAGETFALSREPENDTPAAGNPASQTPYYMPRTEAEEETWPAVLPSARENPSLEDLPPRDCAANTGRQTAGEDPQAAGFVFSEELTDLLYTLFASELTNNTREEDPFHSVSSELKKEMDAASEAFAEGLLSGDQTEEKLQGLSFVWPQDPYRLIHQVGTVSAKVYVFAGQDMQLAKDRIAMTNQAGRHYLFLRVYRNEAANAVRIYLVNALIY